MKIQLCLFLLFLLVGLSAQDGETDALMNSYCKPGVRWKAPSKGILIDYGIYPGINLKSEGADQTNQVSLYSRSRYKIKIPIIHKDFFNLLVGFNHYREQFDFSFIDAKHYDLFNSIDDRALKKSELSVYINKSLNEKFYLSFKAGSSFNGDYEGLINFDNRYANHRIAAVFGFKKGPDRELGFGMYARKGFRNTRVLPFLFYNRTINRKWGYQIVLPIQVKVRYSVDQKNIFLVGTDFKSQDYSLDLKELDQDEFQVMHMRRSDLSLSAEYFRQLGKWVWLSARGGYVYHFKTQFTRLDTYSAVEDNSLNALPSAGPFFKFGLFISPPKNYK